MSRSSNAGSAKPRSLCLYRLAVLANEVTALLTSLYQSRFCNPLVGSSQRMPAHSPFGRLLRIDQNCLGTKTICSTVKSGYIRSNADSIQYVFPMPRDWPVAQTSTFL